MFEHHKHPLISFENFLKRVVKNLVLSIIIIIVSLLIGILGYHFFAALSWIDSLLNASMILAGMGPVAVLQTTSGKIFASFYALFSGIIFLMTIVLILAPIVHRFLHKFHLKD